MSESETGDRAAFLGRIRDRQGPPPTDGPHPPPAPPAVVPVMAYRSLADVDPTDTAALLEVFVAAAIAAEATVDVVDGAVDAAVIERYLAGVAATDHAIVAAVASHESATELTQLHVASAGVSVTPYAPAAAARADLAVTSCTHALASTGSVVVDSFTAGSRAVSLLPRHHLCIVPASVIVPTHADVLRHQARPMPSCRVLITGPSRTGDIEQLLTLGAHGPVSLHLIVVR